VKFGQKSFEPPKFLSAPAPTVIGVRGGGVGGAAAPPVLKNFRANSVFQGKRKLLKNSECKKCIQCSEKFQGNSVFRASAGCSKLQNNKKYIQYSENFQGKRKLLKNPE